MNTFLKTTYFVSVLISLCSCGRSEKEEALKEHSRKISIDSNSFFIDNDFKSETKFGYRESVPNANIDTLLEKLENAKQIDSDYFETLGQKELLLFMRTGYILNTKQKNAILIYENSKNEFTIELYSLVSGKWQLKSIVKDIELNKVQFEVSFVDYNFDDQADIYIQTSVSNGSAASFGLHFMTDSTYGLKENVEMSMLGNLSIDKISKTLTSERVAWCKKNGMRVICKIKHKWDGDNFISLDEKCPCEIEG